MITTGYASQRARCCPINHVHPIHSPWFGFAEATISSFGEPALELPPKLTVEMVCVAHSKGD